MNLRNIKQKCSISLLQSSYRQKRKSRYRSVTCRNTCASVWVPVPAPEFTETHEHPIDFRIGSAIAFALQAPTFSVGSFYKLVGRLKVGDLHVFTIPVQALASGEPCLAAFSLLIAVTSDRQVAHKHGLCQRTGIVKVGAGRIAAFAGPHPVPVVPFFYSFQRWCRLFEHFHFCHRHQSWTNR